MEIPTIMTVAHLIVLLKQDILALEDHQPQLIHALKFVETVTTLEHTLAMTVMPQEVMVAHQVAQLKLVTNAQVVPQQHQMFVTLFAEMDMLEELKLVMMPILTTMMGKN